MRCIEELTVLKLIQLFGSILFLLGALLYIFGSDTVGSFVYLACAACYLTAAIADVTRYGNRVIINKIVQPEDDQTESK